MKRLFCLISVVLMVFSLILPAFASEDIFVPSITYKDGVTISEATMDSEEIKDCLVVTSIIAAKNATTDILQEARDRLLELYNALLNKTTELPIAGNYVIRDFFDISFKKTACVDKGHGHKETFEADNASIHIKFDLSITEGQDFKVFVYIDGKWTLVENVMIDVDYVACDFDELGPVAFCVLEGDSIVDPNAPGDSSRIVLWIIIIIASAGALFGLFFFWYRKRKKDTEN